MITSGLESIPFLFLLGGRLPSLRKSLRPLGLALGVGFGFEAISTYTLS